MKRRTSALSVSAAALLVAAPLLTGCSADSHPGAAAVVGDERITVSQVQSRVEAVRAAQRADDNADQLIAGTGALPLETVQLLVRRELLERTAEDNGVSVSRRDVMDARSRVEQNFGDTEQLEQFGLSYEGGPFTLDQLDDVLREQLLVDGLISELGDEGLGPAVAETAERLGVEINPRYGAWDYERGGFTAGDTPWLTDPAGTADTLPG
ncbi:MULTISPECIES: SurA N-terminal domain-containing protein [Streptomyces]|uniref:SurA N-terminal domain-containing protein n=1 Tax=Streptomyces TaxID=1883 RepID=UPI0013007B11|nr:MULTISPECIES: SurA N-terminal domain-containing protein [Streptomyces]